MLPYSDGTLAISWIGWCPPAKEIAEKLLAGNRYQMAKKFNLRQLLQKEWKKLHQGIKHSQCAPLQEPDPEQARPCREARICLCDDRGKECIKLVSTLQRLLSCRAQAGWLRKKTPTRKVFNNGRLVLRIYCTIDLAVAPSAEDLWVYLPYGNLNSLRFACLQLDYLPSRHNLRQAVLRLPAQQLPCTIYEALYELADTPSDWPYDVEVWELARSHESILTFEPGRRIEVCRHTFRQPATLRRLVAAAAPQAIHRLAIVPYRGPEGFLHISNPSRVLHNKLQTCLFRLRPNPA